MKVNANCLYYYNPCILDQIDACKGNQFKKGDRVRVINLPGCPKANTMGQCYIVPADAVKDDRGRWNTDFAMVSTASLQKEPVAAESAPVS